MANITRNLFEKSLSRFKIGLNDSEKEEFKFSTLQEVYDVIRAIQDAHGSERKMRNMTRIKRFLEAMEEFGKVVEVMLNVSSFVAFIWGPVKFLLLIAKTWTESMDVLLDAYEQIGETIPLLEQYQDHFFKHSHMQRVLGYIYEDILEFHKRALVIFRRKAWKQICHASWKTFNSQFGKILESLKDHAAMIERQASLIEIETNHQAREELKESFNEIERRDQKRHAVTITEKVSPANVEVDQENASARWVKGQGYGLWLLQNTKLKSWLDPTQDDAHLLWLKGIPGAGKTVLTSRLIASIQEMGTCNLVFFYCKGEDNDRNSLIAILKSILCQLLSINSDVFSYIYDECVKSRELTIESSKALRELVAIALDQREPLWFILDGLDEVDAKERKKILKWILPSVGANSGNSNIRLLVVSRDEGDFDRRLSKAPWIALHDTTAHNEEIKEYTSRKMNRIQEKFGISKQDSQEIGKKVTVGAKGMSLFARLILKHLKSQTSLSTLRSEVNPSQFPDGLDQVYERIVQRIYKNPLTAEREAAQTILEWAVCARRSLRWNELQAIFSINFDTETVDFEDRCLRPKDECHSVVKKLCGSLVEISKGDEIHLVHDTAKIYLTRGNNGQPSRIDISKKELEISKNCWHYLSFPCFSPTLTDSEIVQLLSKGYYAFQEYAIAYCLDHSEAFIKSPSLEDRLSSLGFAVMLDKFLGRNMDNLSSMKVDHLELSTVELRSQIIEKLVLLKSLTSPKPEIKDRFKASSTLTVQTQLERRRTLFESQFGHLQDDSPLWCDYLFFYGACAFWFKCSRIKCWGFWKGFASHEAREAHIQEHERSFRCVSAGCTRETLGFEKFSDLEKHRKTHHPILSTEIVFPSPPNLSANEDAPASIENLSESRIGGIDLGGQDASEDSLIEAANDKLGSLDMFALPTQFKTVNKDWYAIFNPKESRSLDIELLHTFQQQTAVTTVAWDPEGTLIALGSKGYFVVVNVALGKEVCRIETSPDDEDNWTRSITFSPTEKGIIALGDDQNTVNIWNIETRMRQRTFTGHKQEVYCVEYASHGETIASASGDSSIRLWNAGTGTCVGILSGESGFMSVAFSPNQKYVAGGCLDKRVYLWDIGSLSLVHCFSGHTGTVHSIAFSLGGHHVYSGSLDKTFKVWNTGGDTGEDFACIRTVHAALDFVLSVDTIGDDDLVICGSQDGGTYLYSSTREVVICAIFGHDSVISVKGTSGHASVMSVKGSPGSTKMKGMFVTGSANCTACVWRYRPMDLVSAHINGAGLNSGKVKQSPRVGNRKRQDRYGTVSRSQVSRSQARPLAAKSVQKERLALQID